ncbi:MAG TPA: hypothetical protein VG347_13340 [Verrucomicrobiae bacterium]|nr:hypothetical protein [Verrucomicrobiae bacterium]
MKKATPGSSANHISVLTMMFSDRRETWFAVKKGLQAASSFSRLKIVIPTEDFYHLSALKTNIFAISPDRAHHWFSGCVHAGPKP